MEKNSEFLKKVYDKYLTEDYSYGVSNLNPKREISKENLEDAKTIEQKVLEEIEKQFAEIKEETNKILNYKKRNDDTGDDFTTSSGGMGGAGGPKEFSGEGQLYSSLGGNSLFYFPGIDTDDEDSALEREIKQYILKLSPFLGISGTGSGSGGNGVDGSADEDTTGTGILDGVGVLQLNCEGVTFKDLLKKKKDDNNNGNNSNKDNPKHGEPGHVCDSSCPNNPNNPNNGNNGSGSNSGNDDNSNDNSNEDADLNSLDNEKAADEDEQLLLQCALQQLAILQVILILLKVLMNLKKILTLVLSILVPIIKIVSRAASCWVDPPAAAEAIQLIVEKVAAIIIGLIGKILQMIWDSLKLDCLTNVAQDLLNQINQVLAGIDQLSSIGSQMSMMVGGAVKEAEEAAKALEAAKKRAENLKNYKIDEKEMLDAAKKGWDNQFGDKDKVLNQVLPPGAKKLLAATKEIKESMKQLGGKTQEFANFAKMSAGISELTTL